MVSAMRHLFDYKELLDSPSRSRIVTIGNFDGVHRGHQTVLAKARKEADRLGIDLAVLTFEPHPSDLLKPEGPRMRLAEPGRKAALLADCGADLVLAQTFDHGFSSLSPETFVTDVLVRALGAKQVIVGANFRFGHKREGSVSDLKRYGAELGFTVHGEDLVQFDKSCVSSTRIRKLLLAGDVAAARRLLTRHYELPGTVIKGYGQGTDFGFPTANLGDIDVLVPAPGIYAAYCDVGTREYDAAVYIGQRPTLGHGFAIEAFLLDGTDDLYDCRVSLRFIDRIRGDETFSSPKLLVEQIARDVREARRITRADRD